MAQASAPNETEFASLLCSRLCHDLLSPVGALNNGIELLADETDPQMREQCMELLAESARTTAGKLKFFRLAFGAAGGYGEAIALHEAMAAINGIFPTGSKLDVQWMVDGDSLPKPAVKLMLNVALLVGEALPRGGTLAIGAEQRGDMIDIAVRGEGPRITFDTEIRRYLVAAGEGEAVTTRTAAAHLARVIANQHGGSLALSEPGDPFLMIGASLRG